MVMSDNASERLVVSSPLMCALCAALINALRAQARTRAIVGLA